MIMKFQFGKTKIVLEMDGGNGGEVTLAALGY